MPTYEYACAACGHSWEEVQRITEPPIELCPSCKHASAHRLISGGTHFILKGGGWYSDLYASPKPSAKKAEDGAAAAPSAGEPAKSTGDGSGGETSKSPPATPAPSSASSSSSTPSGTGGSGGAKSTAASA